MRRYVQTATALAVLATCALAAQQTHAKRLVIIKVDGVPADLITRFIDRTDPKTGRSSLPWIKRVFGEQGTTVRNFYVRGISLSAPSWCVLDTGRHPVIHGNAEYDRYGPRVYDYLNMFPFYLGFATLRKEDMPGVEVLDEAGVPMLIDHFKPYQRSQGLQLYQRGVRWSTLQRTMRNRVFRPPQVLLNEWQTGFEVSRGLYEQIELEMIDSLANPDMAYLDIFLPEYDHVAHLTEDEVSQLTTLKHLDAIVGRLWNAIEASALGPDTILVLVSDHGMNTEPGTYAQGYNLVRFFNGVEGGAHHVVTNRHPMQMYKLRGLDPFVSEVITKSDTSLYLSGREQSYPTAQLDLDGNERAGIQLRNSDLNELQIALAKARGGSPEAPAAVLAQSIIERNRPAWSKTADEMDEEVAALHRAIQKLHVAVEARKTRKWTPEETRDGLPQAAHRLRAVLASWEQDRRNYSSYVQSVRRLLKWAPGNAPPEIPVRAMGDPNTPEQLRNYVVGPAAGGIASNEAASFRRMDYLTALTSIRVRNNVQQNVPARPVDFIAVRSGDAVLLFGDDDHQLLIESAADPARGVLLRVAPVRGASRKPTEWGPSFPLGLYEDPNLSVPGDRTIWLSGWHSDREWMNAIYRTRYSNAVVGLYEHFRPWRPRELPEVFRRYASPGDESVLLRFVVRRRALVDNDMLVLASDHWNFNVRSFNAGGNHGSFFPMSTRSVLMLAGGGIPQGRSIEQPYDGLSFVPTLLALMGRLGPDERPLYPGPVIEELFPPSPPPATNAAQKVVRSAN